MGRTKVVKFVKNGDLNHVKTVQVTPHRYGHFEELLMDLDKAIGLPYGVRRVYTPDNGHRINSIDQLLDQGIYVCTGFEKFKPINYVDAVQQKSDSNIMNNSHQILLNDHNNPVVTGKVKSTKSNTR